MLSVEKRLNVVILTRILIRIKGYECFKDHGGLNMVKVKMYPFREDIDYRYHFRRNPNMLFTEEPQFQNFFLDSHCLYFFYSDFSKRKKITMDNRFTFFEFLKSGFILHMISRNAV